MARSQDGEFVSKFQMGFIHTNVFSSGWRHISSKGLSGITMDLDAFARTVSCTSIEASLTIPFVSVGKGYSLYTVNGEFGFRGTIIASPFGVIYDDRVV